MSFGRFHLFVLIVTALAAGVVSARPEGPSQNRPKPHVASSPEASVRETASVAQIEGLVAKGEYEKAAKIIRGGDVQNVPADLCNRVGMGLHCGNPAQINLAIDCIGRAVAMAPGSVYYRYNLGVTYWNGGYLAESKKECSKVLDQDPGNVQALQILQRIERSDYSDRVRNNTVRRRRVVLTLNAKLQATPRLAGSWNKEGRIDPLHGWTASPMTVVTTGRSSESVYRTEVDLDCEEGRWYSAIVYGGSAPGVKSSSENNQDHPAENPLYFRRFPVYPVSSAPLEISLERHPVQIPTGFLAPIRPIRSPAEKKNGPPRTVLVCIDSDTWDIVMPFVKSGAMPRLAQLMQEGSYGILHSDPPVSTIAFDRLNFGTAGTFGWFDLVRGSLEVLKERGIDLIHAGSIAGTTNTWSLLAKAGFPSLYISWAEKIFYDKGGRETVESVSLDTKEITVGGRAVPSREAKVWEFLDHAEVPSPTKVTYSDAVAEELVDTGLKKFGDSLKILRDRKPSVAFVHFGFIDTSYHLFWDAQDCDVAYLRPGYHPPRRHARVIEGLHRLMDLFIGDYAAEILEAGDNLVVFSDHGAVGGFAKSWLGHVPEGMFVAAGPSFAKRGLVEPPPDITELVPSLFTICGLKIPSAYSGHPLACLRQAGGPGGHLLGKTTVGDPPSRVTSSGSGIPSSRQ